MKKYLATAALALLMTTAAYAKGNDFTVLERKGTWTAYYQVSNLGNPMCGLWSSWGSQGNRIATVYVKYIAGDLIALQMYKQGWRMKPGTDVNVSMSLDDETFTAVAKSGEDGKNAYLQFRIAPGDEDKFLNLFAEANRIKINFPDGDEPDWNADMVGSRATSTAFRRCAGVIDKNVTTQPTGKAAPTQPTQPGGTSPVKKPAKKDDGSI